MASAEGGQQQHHPRYSLWLKPTRNSGSHALLHSTIGALARQINQEGGHARPAPLFEPHHTLLGLISGMSLEEVKTRVHTLVGQLGCRSIAVEMSGLGKGTFFHQCVFVTVKPTPELLDANAKAREVMGPPSSTSTYMPHISLLYADLSDEAQDSIMEQLKKEGKLRAETVSFEAESIEIWQTEGAEETWHELASIPLSSS